MLNPFDKQFKDGEKWHKEIWEDILKLHYKIISQEDIINKYSSLYSMSKIAVSTPSLYKVFKDFNRDKSLSKQIKPFNFFLVGQKNHRNVKPIAPYSNNPQSAVYEKFIDYKSGKTLKGLEYRKSLADTILEYANHPESKFVNGTQSGKLERRHVNEAELIFIGKEIKNLEQLPLLLDKPLEYKSEKEKIKKILKTTPSEAREKGVTRSALWKIKQKIHKGMKINYKCSALRKLVAK